MTRHAVIGVMVAGGLFVATASQAEVAASRTELRCQAAIAKKTTKHVTCTMGCYTLAATRAFAGKALDRHLKTGHTSTGQNRPTRSGRRDGVGTIADAPP